MRSVALDVKLRRRTLDRELACGVAAWRSPAHAARAAQLTSARHRRRLAEALENLIWAATSPPSQRAAGAIAPSRRSIQATAGQIRGLADRLRSDVPVAAAGVIRLEALVCDGAGPVYRPEETEALDNALTMAARWLDVEE